MAISFIIPICIKDNIHLFVLNKCITSIIEYTEYQNIYLIDDSNEEYKDLLDNLINQYKNVYIKKTLNKGSADQQVFKYILDLPDNNYFIIQDSMFINCKINITKNIQFLWHFTNHIYDWDKIEEPQTLHNQIYNIKSHTDLIRHQLIKYYLNTEFIEWALYQLDHKYNWCGCFGNCCIITKEAVQFLNQKTNFANIFINNISNRERRANETIFSLICYYYMPLNDYIDSFDGLYYDGVNINEYRDLPIIINDTIFNYCCKNKYLSKISFNR